MDARDFAEMKHLLLARAESAHASAGGIEPVLLSMTVFHCPVSHMRLCFLKYTTMNSDTNSIPNRMERNGITIVGSSHIDSAWKGT